MKHRFVPEISQKTYLPWVKTVVNVDGEKFDLDVKLGAVETGQPCQRCGRFEAVKLHFVSHVYREATDSTGAVVDLETDGRGALIIIALRKKETQILCQGCAVKELRRVIRFQAEHPEPRIEIPYREAGIGHRIW